MKATDLARLKGTKIMGQMKQARAAGKPGAAPADGSARGGERSMTCRSGRSTCSATRRCV
jgi:hypothetical protein